MGEGEVAGLTGVRHGDLADFIGVEPDLALAALEHAGREALLQLERHHLLRRRGALPAVWVCVVQGLGKCGGGARGGFI